MVIGDMGGALPSADMTVSQAGALYGDGLALICVATDRRWTWAELAAQVQTTTVAWHAVGAAGRCVAISASADADTVIALLTCRELGATAVMIQPDAPTAIVAEQLVNVAAEYWTGPRSEATGNLPVLMLGTALSSDERLETLSSGGTVIHTSGSSGSAKALFHRWDNHYWSAQGVIEALELQAVDRWLICLPFAHVAGVAIIFRCLLTGAAMVIAQRPDWRTFADQEVSHASLVPTQLVRLLAAADVPPTGLKVLLIGGAASSATAVAEGLERGLPLVIGYGSTEMAATITAAVLEKGDPVPEHCGCVLSHREVAIDASGEILVRGPSLSPGWLRKGELQTLERDDDGWFHTRDRGALDADGHLRVLGRLDNMFISGGENIQPERVEAELVRLPSVDRACVVSIADPDLGGRAVAFVQWRDHPVPTTDVVDALSERLPRFMIPRSYLCWPEDEPPGLKVDRQRLQRLAEQENPQN